MILVVPAREEGRGGGHLVRCTKLVSELQSLGINAALYDPIRANSCNSWTNLNFIILDRFQTPADELSRWKELAPVIGIDEGGANRDDFDFLIDILPNLEKTRANVSDIGLLPLPEKKKILTQRTQRRAEDYKKILVSFGLEDSAGLGNRVINIIKNKKNDKFEITFINKENKIDNLAEHLHEYDLVITHFGITAFEASYVGTPVLLINPTPYHEKLAQKAGFSTTTIKKLNKKLCSIRFNSVPFGAKNSLSNLITAFVPHINRVCPVCGSAPPARALARFPDRTYRKCTHCKIIFMDRLTPAPITYGKEYFFEEYKKQYGKTYLEDFDNLKTIAKRRIKLIKGIREQGAGSKKSSKTYSLLPTPYSLLDIGCAYGAFLYAARDEGFEVHGIDPCKDAVEYVNEKLGINATCSLFPAPCSLLPSPCNTITLWYTIEHFQNCIHVLKEINTLLVPGELLAFSTPSFAGISGRKNLRKFLQNSPADHFTIWSPSSCKKALALYGFKVKKIVNTGHHPERFPVFGKLACCHLLLKIISKIFSLGDTFEVYAVKKLPTN